MAWLKTCLPQWDANMRHKQLACLAPLPESNTSKSTTKWEGKGGGAI
eukprot:CAMPEP_0174313626 /NCGR_PEP_ID=MMETSP0810-20121108/5108_1 /TAXON_ID=73025 ORGANISM="Eutreptiella gymnastica-like, Strain CCMP1594" /NCGR_SAMPLE_ID=MMETSP0810 /ASSEMBLY_ACC=CAM_ASM_000659 /LENGTH=46 /DNA_ID= /DNA_START= /DNA_END= /DNA_ORIENTATION=